MTRFASLTDRLDGFGAAKWAVHMEGRRRQRAGEPVTMLSIGEPDLAPPAAVVDAAVAGLRAGRTRYTPGRGTPEAVAAVAAYLSRRSGHPVSTDDVLCVPGTQAGLFAVFSALVEHGDEVLVPDPFYATYDGVIAATGATFVPVPASPDDGFHVRAEVLAAAVTSRTRAVLLNSPANPTGAVLSAAELDAIGAVCEAHDLWLVCDEVYAELTFDRPFASPLDSPRWRERAIVTASISKSHALPGFRSGWVAAPAEAARRIALVSDTMLFGMQPFLGDALVVALSERHAEVDALRCAFAERARAVVGALAGSSACSARMPEGGMFLLVDVRPTGLTGEDFAWRLVGETGVVVMPGESFGAGAAGHVRVALSAEADVLAAACGQLRELAERLATERAALS